MNVYEVIGVHIFTETKNVLVTHFLSNYAARSYRL